MPVRLTVPTSLAGPTFPKALDQHVTWNLSVLDLDDGVYGKPIDELNLTDVRRAVAVLEERNLSVYCLSTSLFGQEIERGRDYFRLHHLARLDRVLKIAEVLKPRLIRLLAPQTIKRKDMKDSFDFLRTHGRWVLEIFQEAIDRIDLKGFRATIQNQAGECIFSNVQEILSFFKELGNRERVCLSWDVQSLWQMGTFPSVDVYEKLKPVFGYYHLRGGQHDGLRPDLRWRSCLEDASWPVLEVTRRVVKDGFSPVICVDRSLGIPRPDYDYGNCTERDIWFLRKSIPEFR
ncbi:MAG TPA: xylose isomerase [Planctomycetota bacterium]|jgi:hypothetical protein